MHCLWASSSHLAWWQSRSRLRRWCWYRRRAYSLPWVARCYFGSASLIRTRLVGWPILASASDSYSTSSTLTAHIVAFDCTSLLAELENWTLHDAPIQYPCKLLPHPIPPSPPQRQNMLPQHDLSTKRTFRLLPNPIPNASPAKYMPARRRARIPHLLQTQCTFPLLPPLNPLHCLRIFEIVPRTGEDGRMCCLLDTWCGGMVLRRGCRLEE